MENFFVRILFALTVYICMQSLSLSLSLSRVICIFYNKQKCTRFKTAFEGLEGNFQDKFSTKQTFFTCVR